MKKIINFLVMTLILVLTTAQTRGQDIEEQRFLYQTKITRFSNMQSGGTALLIAGTVFTVGGLVTYYKGMDQKENFESQRDIDDGEMRAFAGIFVAALGVDMMAGGIVLISIGHRKKNEYEIKLKNIAIGNGTHGIGLGLQVGL